MKFSSLFVQCIGLSLLIDSSLAEEGVLHEEEQCGLYMAISSTSTVDETKWGIYAGKDYDSGTEIGYPEVAVNIFNLQANAGLEEEIDEDDEEVSALLRTIDFFEQFIWVPIPAGAQFELKDGRAVTAIPGAGVLGGYNPGLTNADWNHTTALIRDAWNEEAGVSHPGRGAYSNFFNVALRATRKITAGREIFLDYGDNWEEEHQDEQLEEADFDKLDETILKMEEFFKKYEGQLDETSKGHIYEFLIHDVMNAAVGENKGKKIADILPSDPDLLEQVKKRGGSYSYSQPQSHRDLDWLQQHGRCMDNIKAGPSTIPNAGRGAFATRTIKDGSLVSPIPLIHLPVNRIVDMHDIGFSENAEAEQELYRLSDEVTGQQLLLNYCFGHPQSSMLFFPAGAVSALINHDSEKANAKLVWSKHPGHQSHWLQEEPLHLLSDENSYVGLILEVVATREIQEGEEIFLNYGKEWEDAWNEHQQRWEENMREGKIPTEWPLRAIDMNEIYHRSKDYNGEVKKFKTKQELSQEPYPENVSLKCFATAIEQEEDHMQNGVYVRQWEQPNELDEPWIFDGNDHLFDCAIISRTRIKVENPDDKTATPRASYVYTVERKIDDDEVDIIVKDVPQEAFVFVDKPGTGDQFSYTEFAFRHYIGIPDEIFPVGPWRDLAE